MKKVWILVCLCALCLSAESRLNVLVTILPQKAMVELVGGEFVRVNVLVPTNKSPEIYEPSISQLKDIEQSDVFIGVGMPLESSWLKRFKGINKKLLYYNLADFVESVDSSHAYNHAHNLHIWTSPHNAKIMLESIANILSTHLPDKKDYFTSNANALKTQLDAIISQAKAIFDGVESKAFLVYHPAFSDFARDFNLAELSIEKDGKEPKGRDLIDLISTIKAQNLKALFIQPQFDKQRVSSFAKGQNLSIIELDPLMADWLQSYKIWTCQIAFMLESSATSACIARHFKD